MTQQHPVLLQIIIANSALHMSNAYQKSIVLDNTTALPSRHNTNSPDSPSSGSTTSQELSQPYGDALAAKQRALYLLKSALTNLDSVDIDVTLAVVLLFIEFELIDSGRDNWKHHIQGARTIIETLNRSPTPKETTMSPLRSCLIANCMVYVMPLIPA